MNRMQIVDWLEGEQSRQLEEGDTKYKQTRQAQGLAGSFGRGLIIGQHYGADLVAAGR